MTLDFKITGTKKNPDVEFDASTRTLSIVGRSVLNNMDDNFYGPVIDFLAEYAKTGEDNLIVEFQLDYFNTSSHPSIIQIFRKTAEIHASGRSSEIHWKYAFDDEEMKEIGEELQKFSPIKFEFIQSE